jgi:hypothetical protein
MYRVSGEVVVGDIMYSVSGDVVVGDIMYSISGDIMYSISRAILQMGQD